MALLRTIVIGLFALVLASPDARAQASRTWVSGVGDDANPCSRTAPCKTFAGAISKTAAKGEINIIDPGGFGAVTITKSISIIGEGATAGILASGTNGIIINAAVTDTIVLEGLDIEGFGTGLNGVRILRAGSVVIRRSSIRGFLPLQSAAIAIDTADAVKVSVVDSILVNNDFGIKIVPTALPDAIVLVERTLIASNRVGIRIFSNGILRLSSSSVVHNSAGMVFVGTGSIISLGNNVIEGNVSDELPTVTTPLK